MVRGDFVVSATAPRPSVSSVGGADSDGDVPDIESVRESVRFLATNRTAHAATIFWCGSPLHPDVEVSYGSLQPGETKTQDTFDEHVWQLRGEGGEVSELIASASEQQQELTLLPAGGVRASVGLVQRSSTAVAPTVAPMGVTGVPRGAQSGWVQQPPKSGPHGGEVCPSEVCVLLLVVGFALLVAGYVETDRLQGLATPSGELGVW